MHLHFAGGEFGVLEGGEFPGPGLPAVLAPGHGEGGGESVDAGDDHGRAAHGFHGEFLAEDPLGAGFLEAAVVAFEVEQEKVRKNSFARLQDKGFVMAPCVAVILGDKLGHRIEVARLGGCKQASLGAAHLPLGLAPAIQPDGESQYDNGDDESFSIHE